MAKSIFKVLQDGKIIEYQFYPYDLRYKVPQVGGSFYLDSTMDSDTFGNLKIMSTKEGVDISYTVASNNSWITINNKKITLAENTETTVRNGSITLVQSETDDTMDIFFIQEPKAAPLSYVFTAEDGTVDYNTKQYEASSGNTHIYLYSYTGDTDDNTVEKVTFASEDGSSLPSWITSMRKIDDGVVGKLHYFITFSENVTYESRIAPIVFTQTDSGKTVKVNLYQKGKVLITIPVGVNFTYTNNASTDAFRRFYLDFTNGTNGASIFALMEGNLRPGDSVNVKYPSNELHAEMEALFVATQCSIRSSSNLTEKYEIYCNDQLIIDETIPSTQTTGQTNIIPLRQGINLENQIELLFTGTITYSNP